MAWTIEYDGHSIHNVKQGRYVLEHTCDLEAGTPGTMTFKIPHGHPMHDYPFAVRDPEAEVRLLEDGEELFRGPIISVGGDIDDNVVVECKGQLCYLEDVIVRPYATYNAKDVESGTEFVSGDLFTYIVNSYNKYADPGKAFTVGTNPHVYAMRVSSDYPTTRDEIDDVFCEGFDRYLNARSGPNGERYLDLLDGGTGEGGQVVVLGENVIDINFSEEYNDIVTTIIAKGRIPEVNDTDEAGKQEGVDEAEKAKEDSKEEEVTEEKTSLRDKVDSEESRTFGLEVLSDATYFVDDVELTVDGDRVYNPSLVGKYGYIEKQKEYDATTGTQLLEAVAEDLSLESLHSVEIRSCEVDAVDLHILNPAIQPIRLLEWTHVFATSVGVDEWLPCSKIHIDVNHPESTYYRFGDLPQTLTRRSALRMGMLRRGNGSLIRRFNSNEYNTDNNKNNIVDVDTKVDENDTHLSEVEEGLIQDIVDAETRWSDHLDEQIGTETQKWYNKLSEVEQKDWQGREELGNRLDVMDGKVNALDGKVNDSNSKLMDGIRDLAKNSQVTFYGVCTTDAETTAKVVDFVTKPGGQEFNLVDGVVVDILFTKGSQVDGQGGRYATLRVSGSYVKDVKTNGTRALFVPAMGVVRFVYDGTDWQSMTAIFATKATVGNPGQANFFTDGYDCGLRMGETWYIKSNATGEQIGLEDKNHIKITNDEFLIRKPYGKENLLAITDGGPSYGGLILGHGAICLRPYTTKKEQPLKESDSILLLGMSSAMLGGLTVNISGNTLNLGSRGLFNYNGHAVVMKTIVVNPGGHTYINVSASTLGITDANGYAWAFTNGDEGAATDVAVTAVGYARDTKGIRVRFSAQLNGAIRINLFGFHINREQDTTAPSSPALPEGPSAEEPAEPAGTEDDPIVNTDPFPSPYDPSWLTHEGARPPWELWAEAMAADTEEV